MRSAVASEGSAGGRCRRRCRRFPTVAKIGAPAGGRGNLSIIRFALGLAATEVLVVVLVVALSVVLHVVVVFVVVVVVFSLLKSHKIVVILLLVVALLLLLL